VPTLAKRATFCNLSYLEPPAVTFLCKTSIDETILVTAYFFFGFSKEQWHTILDAAFRDTTTSASTTYTYTIYAYDYHWNESASAGSFTVTTPANGFIDPNRIGVKPVGSYWGGTGENIDVRSMNLNFSVPLLTARTRGMSASLGLVYNSENWLQAPSGTWNLGADAGYGYGWTMQFGSILPVYSGFSTIAYYQFTDGTGATYNLDQNTGNVWISTGGIYASYDANAGLLHFKDGSFWAFGCISAGTEADAGTMYPTTMEDSNGNQILVAYLPGAGVNWANSSSRIDSIADVRLSTSSGVTYQFVYNTDSVPHLTAINNTIGTTENYSFSFLKNQTLQSPFSTPVAFPNTALLTGVTLTGINTTTTFSYTSQQSGLLGSATFPTGGSRAWDYTIAQYLGSVAQPEVANRYLDATTNGTGQIKYPFTTAPTNQSLGIHSSTILDDPDGKGEKAWFFQTNGTQSYSGLATKYESRNGQGGSVNGGTRHQYTWATDAGGNTYLGTDLVSEDMDLATQVQRQTVQTLDAYGNLTQMQVFDYGNLTTPVRTYNNSYLYAQTGKQAYINAYLFNRVYQSTVTDGTNSTTLTTNTYDSGGLANVTGLTFHDSAYSTSFATRGNLTGQTTPSATVSVGVDITGVPLSSTTNGLGVAYTPDSATNSVPTAITPNSQSNLTTTVAYTQALAPSSVTGPNSASASTTLDTYGRLSTSTSVYGAVTNYAYVTTTPFSTTATTKRTLDPDDPGWPGTHGFDDQGL
jgi:hypothetical protein